MINDESRETLKEMRAEAIKAWFYIFVIQLVVGGHAIYELAAEYPGMGLIQYSLLLSIGAAIIAAVLLAIAVVLFAIIGAGFVGFHIWKEKKNDSS